MQIMDWQMLDAAARDAALARPRLEGRGDIDTLARAIIREVRADGDEALRRLAARFDRATLAALQVAPEEFDAAENVLSAAQINALETAIDNVRRFHAAQLGTPLAMDVHARRALRAAIPPDSGRGPVCAGRLRARFPPP